MNVKEFYDSFDGLDAQVSQLSEKVATEKSLVEDLEKRLEAKKFMKEVLAGLKSTPRQRDPGKYAPAFYFATNMTSDDVEGVKKPTLYMPCPKCTSRPRRSKDKPVIMRYEQTEDSPDGDTWVKEAFIMCASHGAYSIRTFSRGGRF